MNIGQEYDHSEIIQDYELQNQCLLFHLRKDLNQFLDPYKIDETQQNRDLCQIQCFYSHDT